MSMDRFLVNPYPSYYTQEVEATLAHKIWQVVAVGTVCITAVAFFVLGLTTASSNSQLVSRPPVITRTASTIGLAQRSTISASRTSPGLVALPPVKAPEEVQESFAGANTRNRTPWGVTSLVLAGVLALVQLYKRWVPTDNEGIDLEALEEEATWAIAAAVGQVKLQYTAEVPVKDASGQTVGTSELCLRTAGVNSRHVIHRKLVAELANRRQSNAHTKTRAEVSGGGKKPYKQKGTGNARRGSNRSPLMVHGGVAFGPRNTKNYKQKINKKEGRLAISSLLQNRASLITVIKDLENAVPVISTKKANELISSWKDEAKGDKVLLVVDMPRELPATHPLILSTRNIPSVRVMSQHTIAVADILWPNQIFVSEKALEALKVRFEVPMEDSDASAAEV